MYVSKPATGFMKICILNIIRKWLRNHKIRVIIVKKTLVFSELQNELVDKEKEYQDLLAQKRNIETKLHSLEEEKYEMDNEVEKQKSLLNDKDREMDMLQKDYELAKDKEAVLMGDR